MGDLYEGLTAAQEASQRTYLDGKEREHEDEVTKLEKDNAALLVENESLRKQLADCQAQSPTTGILVGAWVKPKTGESIPNAISRFEQACGELQIARVYDSAQGPARMVAEAVKWGLGSRAIYGSWKPTNGQATNITNGSMDAAIKKALVDISAQRNDFTFIFCGEHEPDMGWKAGVGGNKYGTDAQVKASIAYIYDLVQAHGDEGIIHSLCLTGWDFSNRIGAYYTAGKCGNVAVDPYFNDDALTMETLLSRHGIYQWVTDEDISWGIAEIGWHVPNHSGTAGPMAGDVTSYDWLWSAEHPPAFVCQFDENKTEGTRNTLGISDKPLPSAAYKELPRA